jgi:outer membrane protein OmpA-like peptidoglycan-associated protein
MKKSEIYALLDVPHFHEGLIRVRRWNYILNFYTGQGEQQVSCQYQIHFDGSSRVQATYWREQSCADLFNRLLTPPPAPPVVQAPAPAPVQVVTQERQIVRKYDFTFAFNSSAISPAGMQVIRQAAQEINAGHFTDVVVTGFTDTVGSTAYNDALSARRAAAAADVLRPLVSLPVASRASRDLDVQTGAQVREERNRRVQIQIYGVTTVTR